ncbi:hypothetical protein B5X24_HaOG206004 [Helicoverpa armigera]|uniref:Uncharacterized protein n=1 Tax=Helicoverpa armigera TaxID=29058 RepID=A0A2W1BPH7_HELAM|nr:hypothetical protein B5X24_HaOG206004 [Helicoverpa armigera]
MRYILYFLVYSCLLVALFSTFLYLMTVVDPGLLHLSDKAARMMKTNREGVQASRDQLPSEMYIDFSEMFNRSRNVV